MFSSKLTSSIFDSEGKHDTKISRKEMSDIWELESKFRIWLDIEIAVCEVYAERGIIPAEDLRIIKEKADFSVDRILK